MTHGVEWPSPLSPPSSSKSGHGDVVGASGWTGSSNVDGKTNDLSYEVTFQTN